MFYSDLNVSILSLTKVIATTNINLLKNVNPDFMRCEAVGLSYLFLLFTAMLDLNM